MIESFGGEGDADRDRRVERVPDQIAQFDGQPRRRGRAGRRHLADLARAEHDGAVTRGGSAARSSTAVYCVAGLAGRDSRNPRPAPRRNLSEASR